MSANHSTLLKHNPSTFQTLDTPSKKLVSLNEVTPQKQPSKAILLDREERALVKKGEQVTKDQMWDLLEAKRFQSLHQNAVNLQGDLIFNRRCPKCTLVPPCQHFSNPEQIMDEANKMIISSSFKSNISPRKIQGLMIAMREQKVASRFGEYTNEHHEYLMQQMVLDNSRATLSTHSRTQKGKRNASTTETFGTRH